MRVLSWTSKQALPPLLQERLIKKVLCRVVTSTLILAFGKLLLLSTQGVNVCGTEHDQMRA